MGFSENRTGNRGDIDCGRDPGAKFGLVKRLGIGAVSFISTSRGVSGDVQARAKSCASVLGVRVASAVPPMGEQPRVVEIQYRGKLGGSVGKKGKKG